MKQPFVTVVIPAYNAAGTISRAIRSALSQTYQATEIVVIDDGSQDKTSEIVSTFRDAKIRLIRLPHNHGEGGVLNEGIAIANGEYIAFLDADDEWLPNKLEIQVPILQENPKATMVTCGSRWLDHSGNVTLDWGTPPNNVGKGDIWRALLAATYIAKPCVVARVSVLRAVGPFDTTVRVAADQDMWIRLAMAGEVEFVSDLLTLVHDTPGSLTKVYATTVDQYVLPMVRRHIDERRHDLSLEEIRGILGERYTSIGRNLYAAGVVTRGTILLLKAIFLGSHIVENLWYLAVASPAARAAKKLIGVPKKVRQTRPKRRTPSDADGRLLKPQEEALAAFPDGPPILIVAVDTEAEFDWTGPFLRSHTGVQNLSRQTLAQDIFDRFGVCPVYLVDYAVATQPEGYEPLREFLRSGRCEIGAHLQSWETPPFEEQLGERTSYSHNLPAWLQKEKLSQLTTAIVAAFGLSPISYRAGRYGIGEEIAWILEGLGYQIDLSVLSGFDLEPRHGPDFRRTFNQPYWFGQHRSLLEIPLTTGFTGLLTRPLPSRTTRRFLYPLLSRPSAIRMHVPGIFARLRLLQRVTLTPEGVSIQELKRLTRTLLGGGHRVFLFSYHSSSLLPGNTPYVRSQLDLHRMLSTIEEYIRFFICNIGGVTKTPAEVRRMLHPQEPGTVRPAAQ